MIDLTINQKAKIAIDKIKNSLRRMSASQGMDGANFDRLKYDADDLLIAVAAINEIRESVVELNFLIEEIKAKAKEIEARQSLRESKLLAKERAARRKKKNTDQ